MPLPKIKYTRAQLEEIKQAVAANNFKIPRAAMRAEDLESQLVSGRGRGGGGDRGDRTDRYGGRRDDDRGGRRDRDKDSWGNSGRRNDRNREAFEDGYEYELMMAAQDKNMLDNAVKEDELALMKQAKAAEKAQDEENARLAEERARQAEEDRQRLAEARQQFGLGDEEFGAPSGGAKASRFSFDEAEEDSKPAQSRADDLTAVTQISGNVANLDKKGTKEDRNLKIAQPGIEESMGLGPAKKADQAPAKIVHQPQQRNQAAAQAAASFQKAAQPKKNQAFVDPCIVSMSGSGAGAGNGNTGGNNSQNNNNNRNNNQNQNNRGGNNNQNQNNNKKGGSSNPAPKGADSNLTNLIANKLQIGGSSGNNGSTGKSSQGTSAAAAPSGALDASAFEAQLLAGKKPASTPAPASQQHQQGGYQQQQPQRQQQQYQQAPQPATVSPPLKPAQGGAPPPAYTPQVSSGQAPQAAAAKGYQQPQMVPGAQYVVHPNMAAYNQQMQQHQQHQQQGMQAPPRTQQQQAQGQQPQQVYYQQQAQAQQAQQQQYAYAYAVSQQAAQQQQQQRR